MFFHYLDKTQNLLSRSNHTTEIPNWGGWSQRGRMQKDGIPAGWRQANTCCKRDRADKIYPVFNSLLGMGHLPQSGPFPLEQLGLIFLIKTWLSFQLCPTASLADVTAHCKILDCINSQTQIVQLLQVDLITRLESCAWAGFFFCSIII